jgi:hypothetical protein
LFEEQKTVIKSDYSSETLKALIITFEWAILWERQPTVSGMELGSKKTAHSGQTQYCTVASRRVLPMVDLVAGTGVVLTVIHEGRYERLP